MSPDPARLAGVEREPQPEQIRAVYDADAEWRRRLNERLRMEFIAGAEEDCRERLGRGLTREELESVLRRYRDDV